MISNRDREKAAGSLVKWLNGDITNWDLEDEWPKQSEDFAVVDIGREIWRFYNDFPQQTLKDLSLSTDELDMVNRCLAFLRSTENYVPVSYEDAVPWQPNVLTRLFGTGERPWETMRLKVDAERQRWWPFANESQWQRVISGIRHESTKPK